MALTVDTPDIELNTPQADSVSRTVAPAAAAIHLLHACRPYQWTKNLAVLLVPMLLLLSLGTDGVIASAGAFVSFCFAASSVYLLNDVVDRHRDLEHPTKRTRPVASGLVAPEVALAVAGAAALTAVAIGIVLTPSLGLVVASYLGISVAYSLGIKRLPYVDVGILAAGYVLRVLGGGIAVGAIAPTLLLLGVFGGATFIALGKRRSEILTLGHQAASHRPALGRYSLDGIDAGLRGAKAVSVAAFGSWIVLSVGGAIGVAAAVAGAVGLHSVLVAYGRIIRDDAGDDPTRDLLSSPLVLSGLAATSLIAISVGVLR